jgi:hypothetical protein
LIGIGFISNNKIYFENSDYIENKTVWSS